MSQNLSVGKRGEDIAERFLKKRNYKILERNFRENWGEIDIIARSKDKTLVFVEVKTVRGPSPQVEPEEHLTKAKLGKVQRTAELYANSSGVPVTEAGWRIDLIAITLNGDVPDIRHYENI